MRVLVPEYPKGFLPVELSIGITTRVTVTEWACAVAAVPPLCFGASLTDLVRVLSRLRLRLRQQTLLTGAGTAASGAACRWQTLNFESLGRWRRLNHVTRLNRPPAPASLG
eukprot:1763289-Rhodomonas_salina.1